MSRVAVIGAGGWGTALAALLAGNGIQTTLWVRSPALATSMRADHENHTYLPGVPLPESLTLSSELAEAVSGAEALVLVVPAQAMREMTLRLADIISGRPILVTCAKGLERGTRARMSEVLRTALPAAAYSGIVALSGPNHAEEVGRGIPSATVVSSVDATAGRRVQALFMAPTFRVYTNTDIVGVEIAGALKNVIALATGMCDGLGFGDNTKAALMTRGMAEMARLGLALGANPLTFAGLAGMGDLIATCTSSHSRNRWAGQELGKGRSLQDILQATPMVVEGVSTTSVALELAAEHGVELPIARVVDGILFHDKNPRSAVAELMERDATCEELPK